MTGEFHNPDFSVRIDTRDFKLSVVESIAVLGIETVVAGELLFDFRMAVGPKGKRVRYDFYSLGFVNEGAGQFTDEECRCARRSLFVLRIPDSQYIARILYQSMLKTSSSPDERPAHFASEANSPNRSIHILVWTTGSTPESIKLFEGFSYRLACK